MMQRKIADFVKRFFIVLLSVALMASVDIAPDYPLQFAAFALIAVLSIRLLWRSAEQDKKRMSKRRRRLYCKSGDMPRTLKRAA